MNTLLFKKNSSFATLNKYSVDNVIPLQISRNFQRSFENRTVFSNTSKSFENLSNKKRIEPIFLHNNRLPGRYLAGNSNVNLNFEALENFKTYLTLIEAASPDRKKMPFKPNRDLTRREKLLRREDSFKANKKFKKKTKTDVWVEVSMPSSRFSESSMQKTRDALAQVKFLLKNKRSLLRGDLKVDSLSLNKEVKATLFSYVHPVGPYGSDAALYSSDLFSKNFLTSIRRINLTTDVSPVTDTNAFKSKVGFFNFNVNSNEEWSNVVDMPLGGHYTGRSFFINSALSIGFGAYAFFEFFVYMYIMSFIFGNPYDTLCFFLKYPLVYYYENLAAFPNPNYFFFSLSFWFVTVVLFTNHLLELFDEERYVVPRLSWVFAFLKEFIYEFIFLWFIIFCSVEVFLFVDLLITRIVFVGSVGYPQIFSSFFLMIYELFYILGTSGYFSLYLESFFYFDLKFPVFYFSDFIPLLQRFPLVQPVHLHNPFFDRPNLFLWLFDNFFNVVSGDSTKSLFFSKDLRFVYQRELLQDVRKYNYIRKHFNDLQMVGQLFLRGWNGFNYRLDLKIISEPIISIENIARFDWRFKNSHFDGLTSRLFRNDLFGSRKYRTKLTRKTLHILRNSAQITSPRYGYLDYLKSKKPTMWVRPAAEHKLREQKLDDMIERSFFFLDFLKQIAYTIEYLMISIHM